MYFTMKTLRLLIVIVALLAVRVPGALSSDATQRQQPSMEFPVDDNTHNNGSLRSNTVGGNERELWEWNFSYLLFLLHHCDLCDCASHSHGPCSCPDCSRHVLPHQKPYCNGELDCSGYYGEDGSGNGGDGDGTSSQYEKDGNQTTTGDSVTRTFLWYIIGGIAGLVAAAGGFIARQRVVAASSTKSAGMVGEAGGSSSGNYNLMMAGGMGAAVAAMMARIGLKKHDDNASTSGSSAGIVSQRMSQSVNGAAIPLERNVTKPSFITIQSDATSTLGVIDDTNEGFEVDGPMRPSSQYAI